MVPSMTSVAEFFVKGAMPESSSAAGTNGLSGIAQWVIHRTLVSKDNLGAPFHGLRCEFELVDFTILR